MSTKNQQLFQVAEKCDSQFREKLFNKAMSHSNDGISKDIMIVIIMSFRCLKANMNIMRREMEDVRKTKGTSR